MSPNAVKAITKLDSVIEHMRRTLFIMRAFLCYLIGLTLIDGLNFWATARFWHLVCISIYAVVIVIYFFLCRKLSFQLAKIRALRWNMMLIDCAPNLNRFMSLLDQGEAIVRDL